MKKEWLWGPGRIAPEHQGLPKQEYLERLAEVRVGYLDKLLQHMAEHEEGHLQQARRILAELHAGAA